MKYLIIQFTPFVLFVFLISCGSDVAETEEHHHDEEDSEIVEFTETQNKNAGIELGNIEMRTISGTISATGFLDTPPQSKISISAPMGGFVKSTKLLQGSSVKKGQVVAVMQHPDYIQIQQEYLENISRLEFLKAEFERQEELAKENVNARKSLEEAKSNYHTMKATVQGLKAKLQMLNISITNLEKGEIQNTINLYSPISGYVTKVNTNIGVFVDPTDVLFEIVNTENLHAELTIFEKDISHIQIGQRVLFTLSGEQNYRVATVQLIGREISTERSVQVHCEIEDQDKELIPGMYLTASIESSSKKVTAVPDDAVIYFESKAFIFIPVTVAHNDEDGHEDHDEQIEAAYSYKMVEVAVGESELGYIEIILPEGFDPLAKIVLKGAYSLMAKMKNSGEGGHVH